MTPYDWQVQVTLDKLAGKDTFVIAGTGAGKSLTFAMVSFMVPKSITWLLAPLNYIEEQLVKEMEGWGVPAVAINQNSNWEEEKQHPLATTKSVFKDTIMLLIGVARSPAANQVSNAPVIESLKFNKERPDFSTAHVLTQLKPFLQYIYHGFR
ncbi:transmembrane protein, putative, partial [Rhizoctonia solani AG-3 Rhs1AP]